MQKFIKFVLNLCFIFFLKFEISRSQTLKQAIDCLYQNNNRLKGEWARVPESQANLTSGLLNILPDIRYSENVDQDVRVTTTLGQTIKRKVSKQRMLSLSQDLSISNVIISPIRAKVNVEYTKINYKLSEQQILFEAINSYIDVLAKEELLKIAIENFEISKKTSELIKKQFELGDTTKTQVEFAFSNLSSRESVKIKAEGDLVASKATYERIFGVKPKNLVFPENLPNCVPDKFDKFARFSIKNNLSLKSFETQTDLSRLNVANSVSVIFPSLSVSYQNVKNDIVEEIIPGTGIKGQEVYQMMLNIPILPRGGSAYSNIIASKFVYNRALYFEKYTYDQVNEEILSNWERVKVSEANLIAAKAAKDFAKNSMDAMRTEYEFGTRSVLELLESERQYYDTSVNLVIARNQRILSYYQVLNTMGLLNRSIFI